MLFGGRRREVSKFVAGSFLAAAVSPVACFEARAVSVNVSWTAGSGSWGAAGNWSPAVVPIPGSAVNIVHNDALSRLITFDYVYSDPLARFVVDQTGSGTTTFSMSSGTIGTRYMTSDEQMVIGNSGRATFLQSGGTNVGLGSNSFYYQVHLGENPGSAGTYNMSGGTLSCAGLLAGVSGAGTFIQSAGLATTDFAYFGTGPGSFGRLDLSGSASFITGNVYAGQGGTALMNQSGGLANFRSALSMGFNDGAATYNLSGGTFLAGNLFLDKAVFNQTGGSATVRNLNLGVAQLPSTWNITGGSFTITNEGFIGSYNGGIGTLNIGSGASVSASYLAVGTMTNQYGASAGTISLTNATLTAFEESIGFGGTGTFLHNSGTHIVQRLFIGDDTTGSGVYNLSGGTLSVGDEFVGGIGTGNFNQTGGRHTVGQALTIADTFQYGCAYSLSGGTLSAVQLENKAGIFNQTGGVATFSLGINGGAGTTNISGPGQLYISRIEQSALSIGTGGFVKCFPNGNAPASISYLHFFDIAGTSGNWAGKWDLNNNALVFDTSFLPNFPDGRVRDYIGTAFAGGSWTGNGLTSSAAAAQAMSVHKTALGYADADALFSSFPAVWNGTVIEDPSILVRYTYVGDFNLDGIVNSADFAALASHFNSTNAFWTDGDCNYDWIVNSLDFNAMASNFGLNISPAPALGGLVPEPASATPILFALLMRRSRRHENRKLSWPVATVSWIGPGGSSGSCDSECSSSSM